MAKFKIDGVERDISDDKIDAVINDYENSSAIFFNSSNGDIVEYKGADIKHAISKKEMVGIYEDEIPKVAKNYNESIAYKQMLDKGAKEQLQDKVDMFKGPDLDNIHNIEVPLSPPVDIPKAKDVVSNFGSAYTQGMDQGWQAAKYGVMDMIGGVGSTFTGVPDADDAKVALNLLNSDKWSSSQSSEMDKLHKRIVKDSPISDMVSSIASKAVGMVSPESRETMRNVFNIAIKTISGPVAIAEFALGVTRYMGDLLDTDPSELIAKQKDEGKSDQEIIATLGNRIKNKNWIDEVKDDARKAISQRKESVGFPAYLGDMASQATVMLPAIAAAAIPGGQGVAAALGAAQMGYMTAGSYGDALKEANDYRMQMSEVGIDIPEADAVSSAMIAGAAEYVGEKIMIDRYLPNIKLGKIANKIMGKGVIAEVVNNPVIKSEFNEVMKQVLSERGVKVLKNGGVDYLKDVLSEGGSEAATSIMQDAAKLIYQREEDYPTISEVLTNAVISARDGAFLGSILGGASKASAMSQSHFRRKKQGQITMASDAKGNVYEILSVDDKGNATVATQGGSSTKVVRQEDLNEQIVVDYPSYQEYAKVWARDKKAKIEAREQMRIYGYNTEMNAYNERIEAYKTKDTQGNATNTIIQAKDKQGNGVYLLSTSPTESGAIMTINEAGEVAMVAYKDLVDISEHNADEILGQAKKHLTQKYDIIRSNDDIDSMAGQSASVVAGETLVDVKIKGSDGQGNVVVDVVDSQENVVGEDIAPISAVSMEVPFDLPSLGMAVNHNGRAAEIKQMGSDYFVIEYTDGAKPSSAQITADELQQIVPMNQAIEVDRESLEKVIKDIEAESESEMDQIQGDTPGDANADLDNGVEQPAEPSLEPQVKIEEHEPEVAPSYPIDKNGSPDFAKFTPKQLFDYTSQSDGLETAIGDAIEEIKRLGGESSKLEKKLEKASIAEKPNLRAKRKKIEQNILQWQGLIDSNSTQPNIVEQSESSDLPPQYQEEATAVEQLDVPEIELSRAESEVDSNPTQAQKQAGNSQYKAYKVDESNQNPKQDAAKAVDTTEKTEQRETQATNNKIGDEAQKQPQKRLVSEERHQELVRILREKLNNLNMGFDPEVFACGCELALFHIESGAIKFKEFSIELIKELGDKVRPYLKSYYNGVRDLPEIPSTNEMDSYEDVSHFDVANFDKQENDLLATAQTVAKEMAIEDQVKKIRKNKAPTQKGADNSVSLKEIDLFSQEEDGGRKEQIGIARTARGVEEVVDTQVRRDGEKGDYSNSSNSEKHGQERRGEESDSRMGEPQQQEIGGLQSGAVDSSSAGDIRPNQKRSGGVSEPSTREKRKNVDLSTPKNTRNNQNERGKDYAPVSPIARFDANIAAIELMRDLTERSELPTEAQMQVLRCYSGWGGLGTFFNNEHSNQGRKLRELLNEQEYDAAAMSINSAYYTPAGIIDYLWDAAIRLGFKGGSILEGSAGIGNIIGSIPQSISKQSDIEAIEIDAISGRILKLLYPDARVHIQGFQDTNIKNGSVDLAITNVPFVTGLHVYDKIDKDLSQKFKNIHDFCIAKNIRKLRDGGIGIFITSNGTLDKSKKLREWIIGQGNADVVGAFRLNNKTFGGTNATSDIIIIRKRVGVTPSASAIDVLNTSIVRTGEYNAGGSHWDKKLQKWVYPKKPAIMEYNKYFQQHPELMGGEMAFAYEKGDTFRPGSVGLYPTESIDQGKMLQEWVDNLQPFSLEGLKQMDSSPARKETTEREGVLILNKDNELCISQRGEAIPLGVNNNKVKGYQKSQCLNDYNSIKTALDNVLNYQIEHKDDKGLQPLLDSLNKSYDDFVSRYGSLNRNTSISFLKNDVDFPSISALEDYKESKTIEGQREVSVTKTNIFNGRVIGYKSEPEPKTVKDGVIASVYKYGGINVEYISEKLNQSVDEVQKEILKERIGFIDPSTARVQVRYEYLSGNVREKIELAKANNANGEYTANIEELEKVIPMDIPAHLIEFSLGSSWIEPQLYKQFLEDEFGITISYINHVEGVWIMRVDSGRHNEKNRQAGVYSEVLKETIYGSDLVEAALNNKATVIKKIVRNSDGEKETVSDKQATQACATRVAEIKDAFKDWAREKMQQDDTLAERMMRLYNDKFNAIVPKSIDDIFLPEYFGGATEAICLYHHQKKSVVRGTTEPLMLAHEVGTGKTFTLISTAMEMRRIGTAKKPMIVVQNATVGQFVNQAKALYPNAKILTLSDRDRTPEGRRSFYGKIKYSDWDIIVVPQSTFEMIPDSPERMLEFIRERIDDKIHAIEAMKEIGAEQQSVHNLEKELSDLEDELASIASGNTSIKKDAKGRAKAADNAAAKAKAQLDRRTDDVQYFDQMGVDAILVDEAHEYKRLGFATMMTRGVKGIDPVGSKKAAGVYLKTRGVLEQNGWKNVIFATGTPISNTAAELWTFMKYLMPKEVMLANDIYYFDDFVRNFGNISQSLEFATNGKFKENTRFASYVNKPELIRLWASVSDTVLTKEVDYVNDKVPKMENDKAQDIFLPQSDGLIDIMRAVRKRLDQFEKMSGKEKRANSSIPLTMYGIAKRAAIDTRLVDRHAIDEPNSKTNKVVEEVLRSVKETQAYRGTVAVFCDNQRRWDGSVVGFDLFDDIKQKLISKGIQEDQIVIMRSGMGIPQKEKIFADVNEGNVRVVIGNTKTLGTGVNIQERLHTLIHMDAPDRPMDYTQRNGRILRQGNLHRQWGKTVRVLRFGVEDSLDVTSYQRLKTKAGFIDSIMDGKSALINNQEGRVLEEEEEGLFDNPVAVLSGSQYALLKNQAEREYRKYINKKLQYEADQTYITNKLRTNDGKIKSNALLIEQNRERLNNVKHLFPDGKVNVLTIAGKECKSDSEIDTALRELVNKPINEKVEAARRNIHHKNEYVTTRLLFDGVDVDVSVCIYRESIYDNKVSAFRIVMHKDVSYSSEKLSIENMPISGGYVRNAVDDILGNVITGNDYSDSISALENANARMLEESKLMSQRNGKLFEYTKELQATQDKVSEYTDLMRKEMEEKEAKYADRGSDAQVELSEDEDEDMRFRSSDELVNERFNEELQQQIDGTLPKGHIYQMGKPSEILLSAGIPNLPIELSAERLDGKSKQDNHPFEIERMINLPEAIQNPIAVFKSTKQNNSRVVLVELTDGKNNFVAVLRTKLEAKEGRNEVNVNTIRSLYPKDNIEGIFDWINSKDNLLLYANKEKTLDFISTQSTNLIAGKNNTKSFSATKVIEFFENPKLSAQIITNIEKNSSLSPIEAAKQAVAEKKALDQSIKDKAGEISEKLGVRINVVESATEIKDDNSNRLKRKRRAKGWFTPSTGEISLVLSNATSLEDALSTMLHEAVGHKGLRELFGEHFDTFLDNVYNNVEESPQLISRKLLELRSSERANLLKLQERSILVSMN